ncbi:hypothetical protein OROGR_002159 [Orobanche gracilis]
MSYCLSNLSIPRSMSSQTAFFNPDPNPLASTFSQSMRTPVVSGRNWATIAVKSMAGQGSDSRNLEPSQRPQAQKRSPQVVPIGLWDRFPTARTMQQMMETMETMMDDPFVYRTDTAGYCRGRTPWEIKEFETEYKLRFDIPGMTREDVKVWVEEKMLVVKAEKLPKKENGEEWSPKSYGRYSSRIALPESVNLEKIKAEVKDGVLYVTVPKASSGSGKIFDISVE